jgi:hypothetical protein
VEGEREGAEVMEENTDSMDLMGLLTVLGVGGGGISERKQEEKI